MKPLIHVLIRIDVWCKTLKRRLKRRFDLFRQSRYRRYLFKQSKDPVRAFRTKTAIAAGLREAPVDDALLLPVQMSDSELRFMPHPDDIKRTEEVLARWRPWMG